MFEESLHGVLVWLGQLLDQIFDGLNSVLRICNLCTTEHQSLKEHAAVVNVYTRIRRITGYRLLHLFICVLGHI